MISAVELDRSALFDGSQERDTNSGRVVKSVTVPGQDDLILLSDVG